MASSPRSWLASAWSSTRGGRSRTGAEPTRPTNSASAAMSPQDRFSWIEQKDGLELRRFEEEAQLDLPRGRAFAGYGAALAVGQIPLEAGAETEIIFVAFTPRPRAVTLQVHRDKEERIAGRWSPDTLRSVHAPSQDPVPGERVRGRQGCAPVADARSPARACPCGAESGSEGRSRSRHRCCAAWPGALTSHPESESVVGAIARRPTISSLPPGMNTWHASH